MITHDNANSAPASLIEPMESRVFLSADALVAADDVDEARHVRYRSFFIVDRTQLQTTDGSDGTLKLA